MRVTFRPLPVWPHKETPAAKRRPRSTFRASYQDTLVLLENEIWHVCPAEVDAANVVLGIGLREQDIRMDGLPRADARQPAHPGVELNFDSRWGRLTYATDVHETWQHNVRAIALSLEALRAVDRYGVSKRGEQYAGWAALSAGPSLEELGRELVERHGSVAAALRAVHPDTGGPDASARNLQAVIAYRDATAVRA